MYVDDLLIASDDQVAITARKQKLDSAFTCKDLRRIRYFTSRIMVYCRGDIAAILSIRSNISHLLPPSSLSPFLNATINYLPHALYHFRRFASTTGKYVLHLDPNPIYGSHFSSLISPDCSSFFLSPLPQLSLSFPASTDYDVVSLSSHSLYSDVEIDEFGEDFSRIFGFDVSGPRVLFCSDSAISLSLKSDVNHYLELKGVDASLIYHHLLQIFG
ncbi:hypothetical protein BVRB_1g009340 [Beta vulgaris subsp. vulgaris]|nr:hypothetical protein BVRB_1g009340 [Beta vulgaris subsp. vulgaris]